MEGPVGVLLRLLPITVKAVVEDDDTTSFGYIQQRRKASSGSVSVCASDALPLPLSVVYFLLGRWRDKIRTSTPLHILSLSEIAALVAFLASFIYLLGFFGIDFVQSLILRPSTDDVSAADADDDVHILKKDSCKFPPCAQSLECSHLPPPSPKHISRIPLHLPKPQPTTTTKALDDIPTRSPIPAPSLASAQEKELEQDEGEDERIISSVVAGITPSYSLESKWGDCKRAAAIRREALQRMAGKSLSGLPLDGFDYDSILGQCCEMPVGYVQIPVGYSVPVATTEGCLVARTNRGCKAIHLCGGATSVLLRDGMTRAPVVRFPNPLPN